MAMVTEIIILVGYVDKSISEEGLDGTEDRLHGRISLLKSEFLAPAGRSGYQRAEL